MQDNTITITGRALAAPDLTYERSVEEVNSSTYRESGATAGQRDEVKLMRNVPTVDAEKNFRGNIRTTQRHTFDVTVDNLDGSGTITAPIVVEVKVTAPVGFAQADVDDVIDRSALLAKSSVGQSLHSWKQSI